MTPLGVSKTVLDLERAVMRNRKKISLSAKTLMDYLIITVSILMTGSVWSRQVIGEDAVKYSNLLLFALSMAYMVASLAKSRMITMSFEQIVYVNSFFFLGAVLMLSRLSYAKHVIMWFLLPFFNTIVISFFMSNKERVAFAERFVRIVCLISVVSLFFYLFGSVFKIIRPSGEIYVNWDLPRYAKSYYNLYYEYPYWMPIDLYGIKGVKNCAIFTETPMFSLFLITAYLIQRSFLPKNTGAQTILLITMLTTFNTTAIISIVVYEAICWMFEKTSRSEINLLKKILLPLVIVGAVLLLRTVLQDKMTTGSYSVRVDHLNASLKAWRSNILFGVGITNVEGVRQFAAYNQGISIGFPYLLAEGGLTAGLMVGIPYLFFLVHAMKRQNVKQIAFAVAFFVPLFLIAVTHSSTLQWFVISLVFVPASDSVTMNRPVKKCRINKLGEERVCGTGSI